MSLYDPGLQPERTELAWGRTALAIAVGSLVSMRILPLLLGTPLWMFAGVFGLMVAALLWIAARVRYRAVYRAMHPVENAARIPDARLLAASAVFAVGVGCVALYATMVSTPG